MDLQAIKDAADKRYKPFPVKIDARTTVNLLPPTKLSDENRSKVLAVLDANETDNIQERLEEAILLIAETPAKGRMLIKALGGDAGYLVETIRQWSEAVQAGEVSPSVS